MLMIPSFQRLQIMAHGWDSYFHSLPPLSSDSSTLKVSSEFEGSVSQPIENIIGHHDIPNTVVSQEEHTTTPILCSNPSINGTDCVYQTHYGAMQWQADIQDTDKDVLSRCGNGNIPNFAIEELSTSSNLLDVELQDIKQDCEILPSSFLEDFSDVSTCSDADVNEMQPPFKFMKPNGLIEPDSESQETETSKQNQPEWSVSSSGSIMSPSIESLCISQAPLVLPVSSMTATADLTYCAQMSREAQDNTSQSCMQNDHISLTSDSKCIDENEKHECKDQQQLNIDRGKDLLQAQKCDSHMGGHKLWLSQTEDLNKELSDDWEVHTCGDQKKYQESTVFTQHSLIASGTVEKDSHDNGEMQELIESKPQPIEEACNKQEHPSSSLPFKAGQYEHVTIDDKEDMWQSISNSIELKDQCMVAHNILPASASLVEDGVDDDNQGKEEHGFEIKSKENGEVCNKQKMFFSSLTSTADEGRTVKYDHKEEMEFTSGSSEAPHQQISDNQANASKLEYASAVDATCFTESQRDIQGLEGCPKGVCSLQFLDDRSLNKTCQETICSDSVDDGDCISIDSCENDKQQSDNLNAILNIIDANVYKSPCMSDQKQSSQHSLTGIERACLNGKSPENGSEAFQEVDKTIEEISPLDHMMYGEPVSEEDSTSDIDETMKPDSIEVAGDENKQSNPVQTSQITSSIKMRKRLQPVVVLKNQELRSVKNMYYCACCQHSTQNVDELVDHNHSKHSNHEFKFCSTCNIYFLNKESAETHSCAIAAEVAQLFVDPTVEKIKGHTCKDCKLTFTKLTWFVRHMRTHTGKTPYKCKCGKYFAQTCSLRKHMRIPGRCRLHKRNVISTSHAINAKAKIAKNNSPIASLPECYVKLVDVCKTNMCKFCNEIFITTDNLRIHKRNVHKIKSRQNLSESKSVCTGPRMSGKHKCPLCPRVFKYSFNMTRHLRDCIKVFTFGCKGKVGNGYQCPLCHATFTFACNRYRHIKNTCLKEFHKKLAKMKTRVNKTIEQKKDTPPVLHTALENVKQYKCNLCPAVFLHSSGKYKHMKKHEMFKNTGKVFRYRHTKRSLLCKKAKPEKGKTQCKDDTLTSTETSNSFVFTCQFCERGFTTSLLLRRHERNHNGERPYRCLECGRQYKTRSSMIAHKRVHQRKIQCTVCKKVLKNIRELIEHRKTHLERGMLQCPDCPMKFQYPAYLLRHLPIHEVKALGKEKKPQAKAKKSMQPLDEPEGQKLLNCSLCKDTFTNSNALLKHSLNHITGSSQQCPFCKRHFSNRRYLISHMRTHVGDKPCPCSTCGKQFYSVKYLKIHQEKSHGIKPLLKTVKPSVVNLTAGKKFPCKYCSRVFNRQARLKKHHYAHNKKSMLVCSKCGQHYGSTKLTQHVRQCTGQPNNTDVSKSSSHCDNSIARKDVKVLLNCPHCPEKFKYRSLLLRHIVKHTGEQPYTCMHCGQKYESQSKCLQHEAFCDGLCKEKHSMIKCDVQVSSFKEANQNKQREGEYKCKFCTKTFTKSRYMRRHILTHTEVNPYRCKACDSCFSRHDHLELHQTHCKGKRRRLEIRIPKIGIDAVGKGWKNNLVTSDAKKQLCFECNICSKSFSTKTNLERHYTMLHNVKKAFICTRCGSGFTLEKSLKRHRLLKCKKTSIIKKGSFEEKQTNKLSKMCAFSDTNRKNICKFCPRSFRMPNHLVVHTRLHTGEKPYGCDGCGERFIRKDYLLRHLSKCSQEKETVLKHCDRCGGLFYEDKLKNHIKRCYGMPNLPEHSRKSTPKRPPNTFSCAYCDSHFVIFSELQHHLILAHPKDALWQSPMSALPLQQHFSNAVNNQENPLDYREDGMKQRGDGRLFDDDDDTGFNERARPFKCTICNKEFIKKSGLIGHTCFHGRQKLYACNKCQREFRNRNHQRSHSRKCKGLQDVAKVYTNNISETQITSEMDLALNDSVILFNQGNQTGTGVLQANFSCKDEPNDSEGKHEECSSKVTKSVHYQCSECDQSFTDGLLLISHLEDHGREGQEKKCNKCSQCGKLCSSKGNLMQHMKTHNDSHSCPDCPETFLTLKELGIHRTYHDPNRPFSCKLCKQKFWTNKSLHNHYSEAHPDDVYACRFCKKKYSLKKSLIRHCRMRHRKSQLNEDVLNDTEDADQHKVKTELSVSDNGDSDNLSTEHSDSDAAPYFPCHVCGKTFLTSESLEDHQRCHLGEKPHECAECGKCFFHASQLRHHQRMHKSEFQCQTCGRGFVSLFALRKHKHSHGKSRPYRCSKCHLSFTGPSQLAEHMATHREDNFPCDLCKCTFSCKSSRVEHRKSHSESGGNFPAVKSQDAKTLTTTKQQKFSCGICKEHFDHPEDLKLHGCRLHPERQYSCPKCDKHFTDGAHLIKHVVTHQPSGPYVYKCYQCNITLSSHQDFLVHLRRHVDSDSEAEIKGGVIHNERPAKIFLCPVCYEHYANAIEFLHHVSTHSDIAYQCKKCNMTFPSKSRLDEHDRCHLTAATQFECTVCAENFLGSDAFRQHRCSHRRQAPAQSEHSDKSINKSPVTHDQPIGGEEEEEEDVDVTGEDSYNCPFCSNRFSSKSSLLEHQNKQHQPGSSFKCDVCGKTFSLRGSLNKHKKKHQKKIEKHERSSDVKQFKCLQCSIAFETVDRLSFHMKMNHKNIGQHRCDMCYRSFSHPSDLRQHQETHVGQVVYECTECDKAFAFPHLLEKHQQTHAGPSPRCCK